MVKVTTTTCFKTSMVKIHKERVCCFSDVHIGVHQNNAFWLNVTQKFITWVKDKLTKEGIQDIILCGDLFHYRDEISVSTIHAASEFLEQLKEFNIIMLVGNHDAYYKDRSDVNSLTPFSGWSNIQIISQVKTSENFNQTLTFVPWGTSMQHIPESDIIFGHFEIESFKMNSHKICDKGINASDLLAKSKLVVSGHFHLRDERKYSNGTILYLGSPYQMDFGDVDNVKGIYLLDLKTKKYEFIENGDYPKHVKINLSDLIKEKGLSENVKKLFTNNITKFIIDKNITADEIDFLLNKLASLKPITITVDYVANFNKFDVQNDNHTDLSGVDIPKAIEDFVNMLEINNKKEIIDYTVELYKKIK
jgi:DNA repair exonuclease SbcCD nuclease subunit